MDFIFPEALFSLILKGGVSFKGKITELKYSAERKLEEGLTGWDMGPKSREQCGTDQTHRPADAGETREVGKGCRYKESDASLLMPLSPPAPYCFCHWAWVRGNCLWGSLCRDVSYIVARNHFWSQQYLSKSAELCYGKAVVEDKCGNVLLSPHQWQSSRKRMGWEAITRYRRGRKRRRRKGAGDSESLPNEKTHSIIFIMILL